jgi:hypothetical protein
VTASRSWASNCSPSSCIRLGALWLLLLCITMVYCRQAKVSPKQNGQRGCKPFCSRCHGYTCIYHIGC